MESTYSSPSSSLSDMEALCYYAGLPSCPRLVARTGTTLWAMPTGPEAYHTVTQLGIVVNHELNTIWEHDVAPEVIACLDEMGILWTSTDIVRIGVVGEESPAPVILWIGVKPKSLACKTADTAAFRCLDILNEFGITDVDVEIRESSVTRSAGPKLLSPAPSSNPTAAVRHPLTHALGLPISAEATPDIAGTGGFFMAEGGDSDELLLITTRHAVLPPSREPNVTFEHEDESQPRYNVLLLGDEAYKSCLSSIKDGIRGHGVMIEYWGRCLKVRDKRDEEQADKRRERIEGDIEAAKKAIDALHTFYNDADKHWATSASRVLGHVVYSPPILLGAGTAAEQYTQDYAIIKVDEDKIDRTEFKGNMIDIGTKIEIGEYVRRMFPNNPSSFHYPDDGHLLMLQSTISDDEMRHPTSLDQNGEPCLMVLKDGSTTGVTIGRASGIMSFVREYSDDGRHETAKEWAILPYDKKSGPFSEQGDSGAVIVDGLGRIGGLLTGGAGVKDSLDISYASPISFIEKSIKAKYPNAHLNPP